MNKIILLVLIFSISLFAQSQKIDWYRINFPPSMIYEPNTNIDNTGYSDKARTKVIDTLKNYNYKYIAMSAKRVMKLAKNNNKNTICFAGLNKNEKREKFLLYSNPHLLSLPNQIIIRKDNDKITKYIDKNGHISLIKLINSDLKISIANGRSYSYKIDNILKNSKNTIQLLSSDISYSYLKQVISKRVDFTIDYPVNINYYILNELLKDDGMLVSYPIAEEYTKIKVYFACSKNSNESKNIIENINNIIKVNEKEFTSYYTDYLTKEQKKVYYNDN